MRRRRGFALIEVLAAFAIALLLLAPIAGTISGVAGSMVGLDRSTARRADLQMAAAAASLAPLRPGSHSIGEFLVRVEIRDFDRRRDLQLAGWQLYDLSVVDGQSGTMLFATVRLGRP